MIELASVRLPVRQSAPPKHFAFEDVPSAAKIEPMQRTAPAHTIIAELTASGSEQLPPSLFWHPSRLVRAVLDSKFSQLGGSERIELVTDTTVFALDALVTGIADQYRLTGIADRLAKHGILQRPVEQTYDETTLKASTPELSRATADRLAEKVKDEILLIPIGNGGIVAGLQMAAYYQQNGRPDMYVYPIRYSRSKDRDLWPRITDEEIVHLRELAKGRTIVVFDEDTVGGVTVGEMMAELRRRDITSGEIWGIVNNDRRSARLRRKQGEWWEGYRSSPLQEIKQVIRRTATRIRQ